MALNLTRAQIDTFWDEGYRPWEIYTTNKEVVIYCGEHMEADTIPGWEIEHVFAKRDTLHLYPFFDCIICMSDMSVVENIHHET
jgi:hypothetical protein